MKIIADIEDIQEGMAALVKLDPRLGPVLELAGMPPLRRNAGGLEGLCRIIVSQQLSVASAAAIWAKVAANLAPLDEKTLLSADDAALRLCGLSAPKMKTLRAIASAVDSGALVIDELSRIPADEAHIRLTKVKGIGPWTADIYLMFCLGHADAFPAGDLALQEALKIAYSLDERPSAKALYAISEQWRPWRSVAARLLWAYYKAAKSREGIS